MSKRPLELLQADVSTVGDLFLEIMTDNLEMIKDLDIRSTEGLEHLLRRWLIPVGRYETDNDIAQHMHMLLISLIKYRSNPLYGNTQQKYAKGGYAEVPMERLDEADLGYATSEDEKEDKKEEEQDDSARILPSFLAQTAEEKANSKKVSEYLAEEHAKASKRLSELRKQPDLDLVSEPSNDPMNPYDKPVIIDEMRKLSLGPKDDPDPSSHEVQATTKTED